MSKNIFDGLTSQERMREGQNLLSRFPELGSFFNKAWLDVLLQPGVGIDDVHPLYWYLTNSMYNERIAQAVIMLANSTNSYKKLIRELKTAQTHGQLVGHIREVEAYYLLRKRGVDVKWRPTIKTKEGKTLSPDLLIKWEVPIYLEILTITESDADINEQRAKTKVQIGVNRIKNNHFAISTSYKEIISIEDSDLIVEFIKSEIPLIEILGSNKESRVFKKDGKEIVRVDFQRIEGLRGWVVGGGPGGLINPSARIKHKILDKIQSFQLPKKEAGNHLNGYLIFLEPVWYGGHDVVSAIMGQHTISFTVPILGVENDQTAIPGHATNGVVHHVAWDDTIAANLDFIASTTTTNGEILGPKSILLVSEGLKIEPDRIKDILFEKTNGGC